MNLIGEYICKLDNKGRLMFPSALRKQLNSETLSDFVMNRGFEQCLVLYPATEWKKITEEINGLNTYVRKNREFIRYFYRGATELTLDKTSRLLIPGSLSKYAGLEKEVVLFAFSNRIEIWDKTRYDNLLTDEPEDFASLAEEVMSKKEVGNDEQLS